MAAGVTEPLYTTDILRLAAGLPDPCELARSDGRAELRSPTCGSRIVIAVQLDDERRIVALSQQVEACAFGQAAAALLEQSASGRSHKEIAETLITLSRWLAQEQEEAGEWPGLDTLAPARARQGRHGAILLPFRALLAAIEDAR
jgi:NifU-like protein involved in Fe-S cluster formation